MREQGREQGRRRCSLVWQPSGAQYSNRERSPKAKGRRGELDDITTKCGVLGGRAGGHLRQGELSAAPTAGRRQGVQGHGRAPGSPRECDAERCMGVPRRQGRVGWVGWDDQDAERRRHNIQALGAGWRCGTGQPWWLAPSRAALLASHSRRPGGWATRASSDGAASVQNQRENLALRRAGWPGRRRPPLARRLPRAQAGGGCRSQLQRSNLRL